MAVQTEKYPHNEGFLVSEANGSRSRSNVTLDASVAVALQAGTVLATDSAGNYVQLDLAATDGTEIASAILLQDFEVTGVATPVAVINRDAEVHTDELIWPAGATDNQKATALAQLATLGIIGRAGAATLQVGPE